MKKHFRYILGAVVFVLFMALAVFGYNSLSKNTLPQGETVSSGLTVTGDESSTHTAKDFTVFDGDGKQVSLSSFSGKPIIVNFWATWCGPCKSELQAFDDMYKEYSGKVEFMMVNLTDGARDTPEIVKDFIDENGYAFPVYLDSAYSAADAYAVTSIPLTLFINSQGVIVDRQIGSMSQSILQGKINNILGESK